MPQPFELENFKLVRSGIRRPQPPRRQKFEYYGKSTHKGVEEVDPDKCKRLVIEPKDADPAELARWKVEHKKKVTNLRLDAQILFYGLYLFSGSREDRLIDIRTWLSKGRVSESDDQPCIFHIQQVWSGFS